MFVHPGDRLRGNEEELAEAVGAGGVDEGDSDWIQDVTGKKGDWTGMASVYCDYTVLCVCVEAAGFIMQGVNLSCQGFI